MLTIETVEFWQNDTLVCTVRYINGRGEAGRADDKDYDIRVWNERGGGRFTKIAQ